MSKRKELVKDYDVQGGKISSFCMVTDGKTTMFGGYGNLLENFIKNKQLCGYPGDEHEVSTVFEDNYEKAKLKLMRFDQSFENMPYDASHRKLVLIVLNCI